MNDTRRGPLNQYTPPMIVLTERQRAVVELVCEGLSYGQIAERLGISPETARAHCVRVADKLPGRLPTLRRILAHACTRFR